MNFNKEQQQAVSHKDGALLVLAGPGSGKTAVITHRTQKLIREYQVAPSSILVVTFTKAAARQMRERFLRLTGEASTQVTFGTVKKTDTGFCVIFCRSHPWMWMMKMIFLSL